MQNEPQINDPNHKSEKKDFSLKTLLLLGLLVFVVWGSYKDKLTVRLSPESSLGVQTSSKQIDVHPEVLNLQESFARVAEAVKPAVVNISTIHLEKYQAVPHEFYFMDPESLFEQFFNFQPQGRPRQKRSPRRNYYERKIPGTGSGVIIDPEGYILTNEHVVRGADEISVTLSDNTEKRYEGKVIGRDERTDLAVVKISAPKKLPFARLGNSDTLRVGDWAIAIGSPFGLEQTVTVGVVSASRQNLSIETRNYRDLIQTDAAINPGNSGGPLLNIHGEVIGINTAIFTPSGGFAGVGFAIPINRAKEIIPQLREKGKVTRGWIGVILENEIDDATASVFGVPDKKGAMVREVLPGYPAEKAGLKRGDIIREFNEKKIDSNSDLQNAVSSTAPGKKVPVKIIRRKATKTLTIETSEAPTSLELLRQGKSPPPEEEEKAPEEKKEWLGITVLEINDQLRQRFAIPEEEKGLIVSSIEPDSKAQEIGLLPGDIIRSINQNLVSSLKSFSEVTKKIKTSDGVVFDISRRGTPIYLSYMGPEK